MKPNEDGQRLVAMSELQTSSIGKMRSFKSNVSNYKSSARPAWKRVFDIVFSAVFFVILSPILIFVTIFILIFDRQSPFFVQERIGADGLKFGCWKFRTMRKNADEIIERLLRSDAVQRKEWDQFQKLTNDPRITFLGKLLRRTSIDELPQLWNVLVGDMSLVGPRPIVEGEVFRYGHNFEMYTSCRPGITGLWQVSGRSTLNYDARVALDVEYASNVSFNRDMIILLKTVVVAMSMNGAR